MVKKLKPGRPPMPASQRKKARTIQLWLDDDVIERLDKLAKKNLLSRSGACRAAVVGWVETMEGSYD